MGKLLGTEKVDAILCVAGGWAGGNAKSKCESFSGLIIHPALLLVQVHGSGLHPVPGQTFSCLPPRIFPVAVRWGSTPRFTEEEKTSHKGDRGLPRWLSIKDPPALQELQEAGVQSLGHRDPLEKGMATHSCVPAWRIPWTEESDGYSP